MQLLTQKLFEHADKSQHTVKLVWVCVISNYKSLFLFFLSIMLFVEFFNPSLSIIHQPLLIFPPFFIRFLKMFFLLDIFTIAHATTPLLLWLFTCCEQPTLFSNIACIIPPLTKMLTLHTIIPNLQTLGNYLCFCYNRYSCSS